MKAFYKPFESIEEIKSRGELIKKGRIIPHWLYEVTPKRFSHCFTSGCNQWAFRMPGGVILFVENHDGEFEAVLKIAARAFKYAEKSELYAKGRNARHIGNSDLSKDTLREFNRNYLSLALLGDGVSDNSYQLQINMDYERLKGGER